MPGTSNLWVLAHTTICRQEGSPSPTFHKTSPCKPGNWRWIYETDISPRLEGDKHGSMGTEPGQYWHARSLSMKKLARFTDQ